jgi:hypothetical protein
VEVSGGTSFDASALRGKTLMHTNRPEKCNFESGASVIVRVNALIAPEK